MSKIIIRGERDADQQGAGDEDIKGPTPELLERVEADDASRRDHLSTGGRGRMRKCEAERGENEAGDARRVERERGLLGLHATDESTQSEADEQSSDDPADRPPDADLRELLFLIGDVVECQ